MSTVHTPDLKLTEQEIELFNEQGFLGPFTAFSPDEMAQHREVILESVLGTPSPHSPYRTQSRHLDSKTIWQLCTAPAIVEKLKSLYGPDLMVWYSNFFDKPPAKPGQEEEYPWHQDLWHWKLEPLMSLSVWLAISPATVENGCVEVLPGTHKSEIPTVQINDSRLSSWFGGQCADPACYDESKKVQMVLQPGQFFIFNEATLHHSNPNRSTERRLGLSFRVTLPSVKSDRPLPCVLLSGEDKSGINPLTPPPVADPDPAAFSSALPNAADYSMDQAVTGLGWHAPERDGEHWFRWTGPETESWLDLSWKEAGDATVICEVLHSVAPEVTQSLQVRVNDEPVSLSWRASGRLTVVAGRVPESVLQKNSDRVRLSVHVGKTLRLCDLNSASNDTRPLGLAIAGLRLTTASVAEIGPPTAAPSDQALLKAVQSLNKTLGSMAKSLDRIAKQADRIAKFQEKQSHSWLTRLFRKLVKK
jgi:Phytanoyl-CoA dioxygenase (PhyH)